MMSLTCRNIGLGRAKLDLVRCGCSSNGSFYTKWICGGDARKSTASKVVCSRRPNASWCDVLSAQTPKTVFDGNDVVDFISCAIAEVTDLTVGFVNAYEEVQVELHHGPNLEFRRAPSIN
ncbi:hypothetical protein Sjap_022150 [Stephania japonica]|uniref:Uncharacterized protein n=1 Tax=Stephania japonica TaxID=461633 RepID=A0AAP0EVK4_9MAGN